MTSDRRQALEAFQRLADHLDLDVTVQAQAEGYRVTGLSPGDVEYSSDNWDGSEAESSYPNPTAEDTDLDFLADHYLFPPQNLTDDDGEPLPKSAYKAPIRQGPAGPVNTNALIAAIGAINGARGGFSGISRDTLQEGFDWAVDALVESGRYEDADSAPPFDPEVNASAADADDFDFDGDLPTDLAAEATGTVQVDVQATDALEAAHDLDGSLGGIVWGAGDHDLSLGGKPTPVRVPPETIEPTFEAAHHDVQQGDVTIGFDHPSPDSVAAKTGIVDIGHAKGVSLSADGRYIVLTDSELTNDRAIEAAERGDFDDLDWSVVADVAIRRDQDGDPVIEDGRVVLDATRIRRIDAVDTGAVDAASIERDSANLPDLRDEARVVQDVAAGLNRTDDAVQALRASATTYHEHMGNTDFDPDIDGDIPDDVQEQLNAAADIIDSQQDELEAAQARADGFDRLLQAHGLDEDDFETPEAAAQAVIDEQTTDIRAEIAELEADLAAYDVDDVEARAEDLAGSDPDDLRNTLNARKAEAFDREQKRQQKGRATARNDQTGRANFSGGSDNSDQDADEIALSAMDGKDRIQAEANGESPSEYVQNEYGLNARNYDAADELHADILDEIKGDA